MMAVLFNDIFRESGITVPDTLAGRQFVRLQYDSRKVGQGDLFIAIRGYETDGHRFVQKAAESGAAAAVVEEPVAGVQIPQVTVPDTRAAMARLAYNLYRPDFDRIDLAGVTGTNGKTTTSFLIRSILNAAGKPAGLIGTIAYYLKDRQVAAWNTTPEAVDIAGMVHEMGATGHDVCVLEVSSHALTLGRVNAFPFRVAVFTNLSHDHLDFHRDIESYFQAKLKLFSLLDKNGRAVVNADDPYGGRILETLRQPALTFGFSEDAEVRALDWTMSAAGTELTVGTRTGELKLYSELISLFNIQNMLAAVATGLVLGVDREAIINGIAALKQVPGRLAKYEIGPGSWAVIDYAHTPDALRKAAGALRGITKNRLIVLFGCGGDRDKAKRPVMGRIAEEVADEVIVTSDNPRFEEPEQIIDEIVAGMSRTEKRKVITDRKQAIFYAVRRAEPGDTVLIAGKGHEPYQSVKGVQYDFNEPELIKEAVKHA